ERRRLDRVGGRGPLGLAGTAPARSRPRAVRADVEPGVGGWSLDLALVSDLIPVAVLELPARAARTLLIAADASEHVDIELRLFRGQGSPPGVGWFDLVGHPLHLPTGWLTTQPSLT